MVKAPKEKKKVGRPQKQIDYVALEGLCKIQATGEECAAILDISYINLNKKLKEDGHDGFVGYYKKYSAGGRASLRRKQMQVALSGDNTLLIWLGKQYLEQKDKLEHGGDQDKPIKVDMSCLLDKFKRMAGNL